MAISNLKAFIYAYNKMGLPVLLGVNFPGLGAHLITVTGYREDTNITFSRTSEMSLKASKIERFYTHDDQVGPFSRMGFTLSGEIITGWWENNTGTIKKQATLLSVFIPIHNKIRLTFENIYSKVRLLDFYLYHRLSSFEIYWDIYLKFSNEYKEDIFKSNELKPSTKYPLLVAPLPKYVWVARGLVKSVKEECLIELIFDATQIATSDFCILINIFNDSLKNLLAVDIKDKAVQDFFINELSEAYLALLKTACL